MLIDGITLAAGSSVTNFKVKKGTSMPASAEDGAMFQLTTAGGGLFPGLHYYDSTASSWIPMDSKSMAGDGKLAKLGSDNRMSVDQLPALAITDTYVVGSEAAMLALPCQTGDVAIRTDLSKSFILKGSAPSVLAEWSELLSPSAPTIIMPYDIATQVSGKPENNAVVLNFVAVRSFTLPANLVGSSASALTAATASTVFSVLKNNAAVNTITFAAAATAGTFGTSATVVFAVGDRLTVKGPATADAALADISLSFLGTAV